MQSLGRESRSEERTEERKGTDGIEIDRQVGEEIFLSESFPFLCFPLQESRFRTQTHQTQECLDSANATG